MAKRQQSRSQQDEQEEIEREPSENGRDEDVERYGQELLGYL